MTSPHKPTDDVVYDLVSIQYHALQGAETYDRYIKDAHEHQEVKQFMTEVRDQDVQRAQRAHELMVSLTKAGGA